MRILFEKMREVNIAELALKDAKIAELREQLQNCNGNAGVLKEALERCEREKEALANQVKGLNEAIEELRRLHRGRRES
jgi:chromosome segregation ATPase